KTIPAETLAELRQKSFALDIRFERAASEKGTGKFGRSAIGRLDEEFGRFLETADLKGFDRDRLLSEGIRYLTSED
ncbi:MAG TPA: hypothetical protein VMS71_02555, partial [Candidatus Acidoferrum sp.]|nr:hypothetical protein [Candidatus Acidoferrum sp.]